MFNATLLAIGTPVVILLAVALFVANMYVRCGSEEILIISGKLFGKNSGKSALTLHGGGAFVYPLIQQYSKLRLTPFSVDVDLKGALSKNNIRINVPSTFTVAVSSKETLMEAAAQRLMGLGAKQIAEQSLEVIFGQLRAAIATMSIEQINADRDKFMEAIEQNVNTELNKLGLEIVNVNITDITDESGYIDAIGQKAAAEAIQKAQVDVAEQNRDGKIGVSTASQQESVAVANQESLSDQGTKKAEAEKRQKIAVLEADAVEGENKAKARTAEYNATLAEKQANAAERSQVAKANAETKILEAQRVRETKLLEKDTIVASEIRKREIKLEAEAIADKIIIEAKAKANAILMEKEAEAKGTKAVLTAKAEGFAKLFNTVEKDQRHLIPTMDVVRNLPSIVEAQTKAISNIKFDKVTVVDSGNGGGSGVAGFLSSLSKALPSVHEILKTAGVNGPDFLGSLTKLPGKETSLNGTGDLPS